MPTLPDRPALFDVVLAEGSDCVRLLQGQLTCDIASLGSGGLQFGAACNTKGRVIAAFIVLRINEGYSFVCAAGVGQLLLDTLKRFLPFYKGCSLRLLEAPHAAWGVVGDALHSEFLEAVGEDPGEACCVALDSGWLARLPGRQERGLRFDSRGEFAVTTVPCGLATWDALGMLDGHFPFGREDSLLFTPQELHFDRNGYVSFTKGCYTGQEIVARMHYRGKPKKELVLVQGSAEAGLAAATGQRLFYQDGSAAGSLLCWRLWEAGGIGLAEVGVDRAGPIAELFDESQRCFAVHAFGTQISTDAGH
jgi:folate-binding protein YgfZ